MTTPHPTHRTPCRRRERGAVQLAAPSVLLLAIFVGALVVDAGRISWNKRELQSVVDLAAIDAIRTFGRCRTTHSNPVVAAQASAERNGYEGQLSQPPNVVEFGSATTVNGVREFTAGGTLAQSTAVRVFATDPVPRSMIASLMFPGEATLQAEAVAMREPVAGIRAGSFAASFDSSNSEIFDDLLSGMLGGPVDLDVLSYEGLVGAEFTVGDLVAAAGVGTVDELMALEMTGGEYLELTAQALSNAGESGAAATLNDLAGVSAGGTVVLGDVLAIADGVENEALDAVLDGFDMLNVGAQVAVGDAAIVLDPLSASVPGVVNTRVLVKIIQAPRIAVGPPGLDPTGQWFTSVRTGQVRMAVEVDVAGVLGMLGNQPVSLDLFVEAAHTVAHLDAIACGDAKDPVHRVVVGTEPGLVRLGVGRYPDFDTSPSPEPSEIVRLTGLFGAPIADVTGSADMSFSSSTQQLDYDGPFVPKLEEPSEDNTQSVGTPVGDAIANALAGMLDNTELDVVLLGGLGLPVGESAVLGAVTDLLEPVITALDPVLQDLFEGLGLHLGGADITVMSLNVDQPSLAR